MNLNLTSIEEAWGKGGVYTHPEFQQAQLDKYMVPKSSQILGEFHPNNITESIPTRMDVSVYDQNVIRKLYNKTPENRTLFVTDLIRRHFVRPATTTTTNSHPEPTTTTTTTPKHRPSKTKEYYMHERCLSWFDDNGDWMIIALFVVLLLDKFLTILKNS